MTRPTGGKYGRTIGFKGAPFYQASGLPAWCYLCGEAHLYQYPCGELERYGQRIERKRKRKERAA